MANTDYKVQVNADEIPERAGVYPTFHALWHLKKMGIVEDLTSFASEPWKLATLRMAGSDMRPTRVAIIDTPVYWQHPNLTNSVNRALSVDFSSSPEGRYQVAESLLRDDEKAQRANITEMLANRGFKEIADGFEAPSPFSDHGTAMAGIIGATPVKEVAFFEPGAINDAGIASGKHVGKMPLPYSGIDPFCEIISISTSAEPWPEQLLSSVRYAEAINADLIVLASALDQPGRAVSFDGESSARGGKPRPVKLPIEVQTIEIEENAVDLWAQFEALILEVSRRLPILCAAGNDSDGVLAYPASLAGDDNGLISVGSWTADEEPASYSPGQISAFPVSCYAYSGDSGRIDRQEVRLDPFSNRLGMVDQDTLYMSGFKYVAFETIVSTDVPGRYGYNPSEFETSYSNPGSSAEEVYLDLPSLFCRFSGTSAATAVAAGLMSLLFSAGIFKKEDGALSIKKQFIGASSGEGKAMAVNWNSIAG